jgi:dinuclear metal center YbgI/SA1388 family protein
MIFVHELEDSLFQWAPKELAEDWDNVGHLVGNGDAPVQKVLVALDITEAVVAEAISLGAQLIISHHPVMNCTWHKVQRIRTDDRQGRILTRLVESHISAICMHTNLDAALGGVNDILAQKLGLFDTEMLNDEKIGRIGTLKSEIPLAEYIPYVVKSLGCNGLRYTDRSKTVHRVAVGGGACGDYIPQAIAKGCDTFVTADLGYHDFLDTTGMNLIDAGHFPTENLICPVIAQRLHQQFPTLEFVQSTAHCRDVIQYYM